MKIRRFWPIQWSPHQTESCLTMKNGFSLTYYTFKNIQKYQNFHPLIFYGYTRLRGVGADLLHPGCNRVKLQTSWKKNKYIFPVFNCKPKGLATLRRCVKLEKGVGLGLGHFQESEIVKSRAVAPPPLNINGNKKTFSGKNCPEIQSAHWPKCSWLKGSEYYFGGRLWSHCFIQYVWQVCCYLY